jgi:glycosyltransferase involved in cell wall biosynthesis
MVLAMSERVGIPYAGFHRLINRRKPFMMMFMCWSWRQELVMTRLGLFKSADVIVVLCNSLREHMIGLGADPNRVFVVPLGIDNVFYAPQPHIQPRPGFIMSVGESRTRDYGALMQAVDGLPVELLVAASGSWYAREKNRMEYAGVPANVTVVRHLPPAELRNYYAQANFVVLPVIPSVASFGGTAALEAFSMGIPVIANRSPGLMDYVIDGETGILVEPGDKEALRNAIEFLLTNPEEAQRMGRNARLAVERGLNMDCYLQRLAALMHSVTMRDAPK